MKKIATTLYNLHELQISKTIISVMIKYNLHRHYKLVKLLADTTAIIKGIHVY